MKNKFIIKRNALHIHIFTFLFFMLVSSCSHWMYDDLPPCKAELRFVYDHNMKFADAFGHEVKRLTVYIFDEAGKIVKTKTVEKESFDKNFTLPLELHPGKYTVLTWAGLYEESYHFTKADANTSIEQLGISIKNAEKKVDYQLKHLWHGMLQIEFDGTGHKIYTVPLIKDTNTFRIAMLTQSSTPIDMNNYDLSISEDNGAYTYMNEIVPNNTITYRPYYQSDALTQKQGETEYAGAVYELRTGRLMANQPTRFTVYSHKANKTVLDIDLTDYLAILRMEENANLPLQEYLDRQDQYNITFFFTEGTSPEENFLSVQVYINNWLIRVQHVKQ